jgi:hypothetical protein
MPRPVALVYDVQIASAAQRGDNDEALELTIAQRQYYEMFNDDPDHAREWARRQQRVRA